MLDFNLQELKFKLLIFSTLLLTSTFVVGQNDQDFTGYYMYFSETDNPESLRILEVILADEDLLLTVINDLNSYLDMPIAVPIIFGDCGMENAFFDRDKNQIVMCNEFSLLMEKIFVAQGLTGEDLEIAVTDATFSIMLHEIGHSLVHILDLPITGSEEDAVDQFSVFGLLNFEDLGEEAMLHFASFWGGLSQMDETDISNLPFWGVHSLSAQRFYNIMCLAYASDPQNLGFLVQNGFLPEERAGSCGGELDRVLHAWSSLLSPYSNE